VKKIERDEKRTKKRLHNVAKLQLLRANGDLARTDLFDVLKGSLHAEADPTALELLLYEHAGDNNREAPSLIDALVQIKLMGPGQI
jgi:hypothetical protein